MNMTMAGHYIPGKSLLHRLNGITKMLSFFAFISAIILTHTLGGYLRVTAIVLLVVWLSGIGFRSAFSTIRPMIMFFGIIFLMNALFSTTEGAIFSWGIIHLSYGGILQGIHVILRLILIMVLGNVLTATTPPIEIIGALETMISPLKIFRLPTEDIAMILGVAIQFIPTLHEEAQQIRKAQIARGARFESKRFIERATSMLPLIVPIFLAAFRRADELSLAMEARGYRRASGRSKKGKEPFHVPEVVTLGVSGVLCIVQIIL